MRAAAALLAATLAASPLSAPCAADAPRPLTLTVTNEEAGVLLNKLGELPWRDVNPLMTKLIAQINEQSKAAPPRHVRPGGRR